MEQASLRGENGNKRVPRGLNASALKIIAVISMTLYSIGIRVIEGLYNQKILPQGKVGVFIYMLFTILGMPSFVLFTFLITEGFKHTSNRKHYLLRLCAAAVLSELPFDLFYSGTGNMLMQNVIFTYIVAYLTIWLIDSIL